MRSRKEPTKQIVVTDIQKTAVVNETLLRAARELLMRIEETDPWIVKGSEIRDLRDKMSDLIDRYDSCFGLTGRNRVYLEIKYSPAKVRKKELEQVYPVYGVGADR